MRRHHHSDRINDGNAEERVRGARALRARAEVVDLGRRVRGVRVPTPSRLLPSDLNYPEY